MAHLEIPIGILMFRRISAAFIALDTGLFFGIGCDTIPVKKDVEELRRIFTYFRLSVSISFDL